MAGNKEFNQGNFRGAIEQYSLALKTLAIPLPAAAASNSQAVRHYQA